MRVLEGYATWRQRQRGLSVEQLTDEELARIIVGVSDEDIDVRHLSDEELVAIAYGGHHAHN